MQVIIDEIVSNVRALDRDAVLSPATLQKIVEACLRAVREDLAHEQRSSGERKVSSVSRTPWER